MSKYKLGLVNIKTGAIAVDGDMGTTLTAIGDTVAGSATMTTSDDTKTDFNIEESSSPVMSIISTPGAITLTWSTYNNDVDNLVRMFGGTKVAGNGTTTGDTWNAPDTFQELEQSIEVQWKSGGKVIIPRAKISGKLNLSFKKDTLSQLDITATVLQPTKAGVSRLSIQNDTV